LQTDQLLRRRSYPVDVNAAPPKVHPHVAAIGPTQARKRLSERRDKKLPIRIVFVGGHEHADAPQPVALLRPRRERPSRRAAEPGDEFAPSKAINKKGMVAIGKVDFTSREHMIALEARRKGLMGVTLRYPYEIRKEGDYFGDIPDEKIPSDMLELAGHIVDTKTGDFDPGKFEINTRARFGNC
jgi:hypothetical protein